MRACVFVRMHKCGCVCVCVCVCVSVIRVYRVTPPTSGHSRRNTFPPASTPVAGLVLCGDATFPGIGVPAVAASGMIAANSALGLETVPKHLKLLDRIEAAAVV